MCVSEPTGVRELAVYPLSPTAVILSWQRPYHVTFRKYVLQTFFFNPVTLSSEWSTYYQIAASSALSASVVTHTHTHLHTHRYTHRNTHLHTHTLSLDGRSFCGSTNPVCPVRG